MGPKVCGAWGDGPLAGFPCRGGTVLMKADLKKNVGAEKSLAAWGPWGPLWRIERKKGKKSTGKIYGKHTKKTKHP